MIKKWVFPFLGLDGKEVPDAQAFFKALAKSEDGFYPIGANELWHGGIHFGAGTASSLKQDQGVRCIADGEIVAYRIDSVPPRIIYTNRREAKYSSGFVLVRHKLVLPPAPSPNPESNPPAGESPPPPAEDTLVFFSLYMHTMSLDAYKANPKIARPSFWGGAATQYIVGESCKDKNETLAPGKVGLNIRDGGAANKVVGLLPRGAIVTLGSASTAKPHYFKINQVHSGAEGGHIPSTTPIGYVHRASLSPLKEPDTGALNAVYVLPRPVKVDAGALVGHLGIYQRYTDVAASPLARPLLHVEVFAGSDLPAFIQRSRQRAATLDAKEKNRFLIDVGTKVCRPAAADVTVAVGTQLKETADSPKNGVWAKAKRIEKKIVARSELKNYNASKKTYTYGSETVNFTGRFFGANDTEVTSDTVVANDKGYARREILVATGDPIWVERTALANSVTVRQGWSAFPLQLSKPSQTTIAQSRVFTRAELEKMPRQATDPDKVKWYDLTNVGWVREKDHPGTAWKSAWDWAGFDIIEENTQLADQYARRIHQQGGATGAEQPAFKQRADAVDGGPLMKAVRKAIDKMEQEDGIITASELKKALNTAWLADRLGRLIVKYESEWGGDFAKWDALDEMMRDGLADWKAEKLRIKQLAFWNKVTSVEGFPGDPKVHYLHPVGVIGNFKINGGRITVELLEKVYGIKGDWFTGAGGGRTFAKNFKENYLGVYGYDKHKFVNLLNEALERYEINLPYQQAHFLAQIFHESAHLDTTLEYATGEGYNPGVHSGAIENGNTEPGDGPKYRGRGLIQLTWKNNYRSYSNYRGLGDKFVENPDLIASDMFNAIDAACWYWRKKGAISKLYNANGDINVLIENDKNNVALITKAVNGGSRGLDERIELFNKIKHEWGLH